MAEEEKIAGIVRKKGWGKKLGIEEKVSGIVDRCELAPPGCTIVPAYLVLTKRKRRVGEGSLMSLYYVSLDRGIFASMLDLHEPEVRVLAEKILEARG